MVKKKEHNTRKKKTVAIRHTVKRERSPFVPHSSGHKINGGVNNPKHTMGKGHRKNNGKSRLPTLKKKEPVFDGLFSNKVGIDLGTATTVVHVEGKGVIMVEPTLVAINTRTKQVISVGKKARAMIGRTPEHVDVIQPIQKGVVCDYHVTEQLFEYIFRKVQDAHPRIFGPTVIVGVPCCTSNTEINAVKDVALDAGARRVFVVYEPFAAAVGLNIFLEEETSNMIIDVGGGTSDIMILVGKEIIASDSVQIAGNEFDKVIVEGLREKKKLIAGTKIAEDLKMNVMSSADNKRVFNVQGRSAENGLPLEVKVTFDEVLGFVTPHIDDIVAHVRELIKRVSPEVLADLQNKNIHFVGGGPFMYSFLKKIEKSLNLKVVVPDNPTVVVARGTALIARNPKLYEKYFL